MAGMPRSIVARATEILENLEKKVIQEGEGTLSAPGQRLKQAAADPIQLSIFETVDPLAGKLKAELRQLDLHRMTPIECMLRLNEFKKWVEETGEG
jgi:DNA mismatch repair protein MutS